MSETDWRERRRTRDVARLGELKLAVGHFAKEAIGDSRKDQPVGNPEAQPADNAIRGLSAIDVEEALRLLRAIDALNDGQRAAFFVGAELDEEQRRFLGELLKAGYVTRVRTDARTGPPSQPPA